ncbi:hypothetical protein Pth03_81100 [Planotetraspora thailandica]|uniref:Glyoxalase/fosfomycin resistance/dioxygenase domain-containing protein n=1 Tax=Planotetraspora thailandica TaxID=487172 RepID=A0A8J3Y2U9_9ACTN|nr:VOC family protein [Planotetraspora thailandica]GII59721.1 hypothetical protein Pth03_81100 [Planotetraspora thailandica]
MRRGDFPAPETGLLLTQFLTVADVASSRAFYTDVLGGEVVDREAELRCYLRDPDGYLIEVGQATGVLEGILADPPARSS